MLLLVVPLQLQHVSNVVSNDSYSSGWCCEGTLRLDYSIYLLVGVLWR